jgi:hypothetical protein
MARLIKHNAPTSQWFFISPSSCKGVADCTSVIGTTTLGSVKPTKVCQEGRRSGRQVVGKFGLESRTGRIRNRSSGGTIQKPLTDQLNKHELPVNCPPDQGGEVVTATCSSKGGLMATIKNHNPFRRVFGTPDGLLG